MNIQKITYSALAGMLMASAALAPLSAAINDADIVYAREKIDTNLQRNKYVRYACYSAIAASTVAAVAVLAGAGPFGGDAKTSPVPTALEVPNKVAQNNFELGKLRAKISPKILSKDWYKKLAYGAASYAGGSILEKYFFGGVIPFVSSIFHNADSYWLIDTYTSINAATSTKKIQYNDGGIVEHVVDEHNVYSFNELSEYAQLLAHATREEDIQHLKVMINSASDVLAVDIAHVLAFMQRTHDALSDETDRVLKQECASLMAYIRTYADSLIEDIEQALASSDYASIAPKVEQFAQTFTTSMHTFERIEMCMQ